MTKSSHFIQIDDGETVHAVGSRIGDSEVVPLRVLVRVEVVSQIKIVFVRPAKVKKMTNESCFH